ncbi:hypothetical protein BO94DRAFT_455408 [Aspergillus sclerotioniger CBS 115572]|uniref:Uncharacterized protein n=1 Tax=Aspergillus sclerotioniger CBS 115572 TaxID=1450535 RepID=A0A317XBN9_9EURO|nr:hypothetical protein BO94DRAFT_455408 [Aspergillus sclerotioniger CBS 115572]PWY95745.1 hypothetical protein BO94DRAFT_455408 [Aspergillus sclerotioniger CBS 115572]
MAGDSKPEVTESAGVGAAAARPSFGSRVGTHFKRWWWVYLIILIVVVLVVVLPVVYVAYPKIAQNLVNKSNLTVTSMVISDPSPSSFILNQTQVIGSNSSYHPTIYSFSAGVSLAGLAAFAHVQVPEFNAHNGVVVDINQRVDITNETAFGDFCKAAILSEEFQLNVYGRPGLKEGSLPKSTVTYNKTTTMKGLNKLEGFELLDMSIGTSNSDGTNAKGSVYIPNPSVISIAVGNLTLNLSVNNTAIGQAFLYDLTLRPGNNTVAMTANISELTVAGMLGNYKNYIIPIDITGNSSVYDNQVIPYIAGALGSLKLQTELNVTKALSGL